MTFIAALRHDGIVAPCVFDGPINGQSFGAYVEQMLLPVLRPGDIYSPDLNPIEQTFAKIKHWMRMAQRREAKDTWRHLGDLIATIKPDECNNYFRNAGYASVKR